MNGRVRTFARTLRGYPSRLRRMLEAAADYRMYRARYARILGDRGQADAARRTVLVVSLTEKLHMVKVESILFKALQLRGARIIVLTWRDAHAAARYHRLFGAAEVVFLDDILSRDRRSAFEAPAAAVARDVRRWRDLFALEHRGSAVGRHVLTVLMGGARQSADAFPAPAAMRDEVGARVADAMASVQAAEELLDRVRPDLVLLPDKGQLYAGEIFDVAVNRGIDVIQWAGTHRNDAFTFKRFTAATRHDHPFSLAGDTWAAVRRMPWSPAHAEQARELFRRSYVGGTWYSRKQSYEDKHVKTPAEVRSALGLDAGRRTAVVFSHILWDATYTYGDNLFDDYEEWLVETVRAACVSPQVDWVIKLHPANVIERTAKGLRGEMRERAALRSRLGGLPAHVRLLDADSDINTFALFGVASWGVTCRGTIGLELPCFGVPVLTAGTGRYAGRGFTTDSSTREEYLARLRAIDQIGITPHQTELACRHAYALFVLRACVFTTFESRYRPLADTGRVVNPQIVLRAASPEALRSAPDLGAFADWALDSRTLDFLDPRAGAVLDVAREEDVYAVAPR